MVTVCSRVRLLARHNLSTSQPFHLTAVGSPSRLKQMSQTHESAAADEAGMREYEIPLSPQQIRHKALIHKCTSMLLDAWRAEQICNKSTQSIQQSINRNQSLAVVLEIFWAGAGQRSHR